jgi:hypothetical protein
VTSADVRLSVGPNLSRATCQRPVDLASADFGPRERSSPLPSGLLVNTWKIFYDAAQIRRYPVSTKFNDAQNDNNEDAESATPVTFDPSIHAGLV